MKYSVIIPVFNEEKNIPALHAEVITVMNNLGQPYEVIVVDDGSVDGTAGVLNTLSPLTVIRLRKNFGQTAALDAGIKHASGEIIITLDGDGQNPPSEIPKLLTVMEEKRVDVVSGWRQERHDPFMKRFVSRGAYGLRSIFVKDHIHDSGCSLKVYKKECFNEVDLFGEMHRFIPAVLAWSGFSIAEAPIAHRPRLHGKTKYNWKRVYKGFIDMLAIWFWRKYARRPLHLFGGLGLGLIVGAILLFIALFIKKFIFHHGLADSNIPLLAVLLTILGVQFFIFGLLADILIRIYYDGPRKPYAIKEILTIKK
ncbi:MAG: glycosyltransferase family 2 protein [Candidatus Kerfeldbacteria bacterium]|nr:glycosyltransferase family 2 protein [Candidatus Kerfeldbacteria bacterium]